MIRGVDSHELERLRRSVAMLPPGHSAGALTREAAMALICEVRIARSETDRYLRAITELRRVLEALDPATIPREPVVGRDEWKRGHG
jgi:hypothetical protein